MLCTDTGTGTHADAAAVLDWCGCIVWYNCQPWPLSLAEPIVWSLPLHAVRARTAKALHMCTSMPNGGQFIPPMWRLWCSCSATLTLVDLWCGSPFTRTHLAHHYGLHHWVLLQQLAKVKPSVAGNLQQVQVYAYWFQNATRPMLY